MEQRKVNGKEKGEIRQRKVTGKHDGKKAAGNFRCHSGFLE